MKALGNEHAEDAEIRDIEGEADDITELQENLDAQLGAIFEQFGGGDNDINFKINIYRVEENKGELSYCFSCVPSELPILDRIREEYGAGKYETRVYQQGGPGRRTKLIKRTKLNIAKQIAVVKRTDSGGQDLAAVIAAMMESQKRQFEQLQAMMQRQPAPVESANPFGLFKEMAAAMAAFREMMPAPANPFENLSTILELVRDAKDGDREKGIFDVVQSVAEKAMPVILDLAKSRTVPAYQPAAPAAPGAPAAPDAAQLSGPPTPQQGDEMNASLMFKMQLNMLVGQARANSDPSLYAEMILDNVPEDQVNVLLNSPDLKRTLTEINPGVAETWPWFERMIAEIRALLTEDGDGDHTSGNETVTGQDGDATATADGATSGNS